MMFFKKYKKVVMGVGAIFLFSISLLMFKRAGSYVVYPFLVAEKKLTTGVKQFLQKRKTNAELVASIEQLEQERKELLAHIVRLHASIDYLDELEELIDFKQRYDQGKGILGQVLLKNFSEQGHFFIVDVGTTAGVAVNMPVVYHNCLIGRVQEVYPLHSKVLLITDSACKVAAYCSHTAAQGIYQGANNSKQGTLENVSHLSQVQEKDFVISGGQGVIFPRGFALGRIARCERNDLEYSITVEPLLSLEALSYVLILPLKLESNITARL